MAKMFGKKITTAEQVKLYNEYNSFLERSKQLKKEQSEKVMIYYEMEGKQAVGKEEDSFAEIGDRGYNYVYPSQDAKTKEWADRELYYKENIEPIDKELEDISLKLGTTANALCVSLWGYNTKIYYHKQALKSAEKELEKQMAYVNRLKKELAELEKET